MALAFSGMNPARSAPITWIGGNNDWADGAANNANWSPADEPDTNDEAIFNTANSVNLTTTNSIIALTLSGNITLDLNSQSLTVNGLSQLAAASGTTQLTVSGASGLLATDSLTINSGGRIHLVGGTVQVEEETGDGLLDINPGGVLSGYGVINLTDTPAAATTLLSNDGTISASRAGLTLFGPPVAGTLQINAADPDARMDVDGALSNGVITVGRNQTLDINVAPVGTIGGDINLFHNSTLDISATWTLSTGATLDVDNGFVPASFPFPSIPADIAYIMGPNFLQNAGTITVIDTDGTLQFNTPFVMNGGDFVNNGHVIFNADATIAAGANFTMPTNFSSITVNAGVTVNVDQASFNPDGNSTDTNIITVNAGGNLDLDLTTNGSGNVLAGLIRLNGGELDVTLDVNLWAINDGLEVGANTGLSQINGNTVSFFNANVSVGANSILRIGAPVEFHSGCTFTGAGSLVIQGTSVVALTTTINTGTFDWDGSGVGSLQTINDGNIIFTINSATFDDDGDMDDPISLGGNGAQLIVNGSTQWTMRGIFTANTAAAGTATIGGTSQFHLASTMNVNGNTTVSAPIFFETGSFVDIDAGMTFNTNGAATYAAGTIDGAGTFDPAASNTVTGDFTLNPDNFNFDAGNWTIESGAELVFNVIDYDPDSATNAFDSTITLNNGAVLANSADPEFVMEGVLNMNASGGQGAEWSGDPIDIGNDAGTLDADLNVTGDGNPNSQGRFFAQIDFNSDADVNVAAGGSLHFNSTVNFDTVNGANNAEFTGAGTLSFNGIVNVNESVTLNMVGGTVDLDGNDAIGDFINIDAPLTINALTLASFGRTNGGGGTNTLDINNSVGTGVLTVNLDVATSKWTLNAQGVMNLVNDNTEATLLAGSAVNLNGTVNVTGDVRTTARLDIAGVVNINTAGQPLRLAGGDIGPNVNTISGGTIGGVGLLGADTGKALQGFGTINSQIDFDGVAFIRAEGGTLNLNGAILDVGSLLVSLGGTMNLGTATNTNVTDNGITLSGGTLQGSALTSATASALQGITGFGTISNALTNNGIVTASGGTLALSNNTSDWDGATNAGALSAINNGILNVQDNSFPTFLGSVAANTGGTVFFNGFTTTFGAGSVINLNAGTFHSSETPTISATLFVGAAGDSNFIVDVNRFLNFAATSTTTLNGNLSLSSNNIQIAAGASFSGAGALRIAPLSHALADPNANLNVLVENRGTFRVCGFNTVGRNDVKDFQQFSSGEIIFEFMGTALNQYDRFVVNGAAVLAGNLSTDIDGAYVPALGDTFNIISASAGLSGAFERVLRPSGMANNLKFKVSYTASLVQLTVVTDTFWPWITSFVDLFVLPAGAFDKASDPDKDGLTNLAEFAIDSDPSKGKRAGKLVAKIAPVGGVNAFTYTIPVRSGAVVAAGDPPGGPLLLEQTADGVAYSIEGSDDLASWTLNISEVTGMDASNIQIGLPALSAGWVYRTFRTPDPITGNPRDLMRVVLGGDYVNGSGE